MKFVYPGYSRGCFQHRNEWMVDRSNPVIAAYNGEPGDTRNTIEYAYKLGIEIMTISYPKIKKDRLGIGIRFHEAVQDTRKMNHGKSNPAEE